LCLIFWLGGREREERDDSVDGYCEWFIQKILLGNILGHEIENL
jgi:hypothetical protein